MRSRRCAIQFGIGAFQLLLERFADSIALAFLLGYSEQSAFTRTYKRWTGESPAAARAR